MPASGIQRSATAAVRRALRTLAAEPLALFVMLGSALYFFAQLRDSQRVEIPEPLLEQSSERMRAWLAVPRLDAGQQAEADARVLGDELLFREALRRGLDRDDPVIRERLAQKLLLIAEETHLATREPSATELQAVYARHAGTWGEAARVDTCQVYFRDRPTAAMLARLENTDLDARAGGDCPPSPPGDAFALGHRLSGWDPASIAERFGSGFAGELGATPMRRWSGPLRSVHGWHFVYVLDRTAARIPSFEERAATVRQLWEREQRAEARRALLASLVERYRTQATPGTSDETWRRLAVAAGTLSGASR